MAVLYPAGRRGREGLALRATRCVCFLSPSCGGLRTRCGRAAALGAQAAEHVGDVGEDAVHPGGDQSLHLRALVDSVGMHLEATSVRRGDQCRVDAALIRADADRVGARLIELPLDRRAGLGAGVELDQRQRRVERVDLLQAGLAEGSAVRARRAAGRFQGREGCCPIAGAEDGRER